MMHPFFELQSKTFRMMLNQTENGIAAWTTIALRMPALAAESVSGKAPSAETRRMVQEKLAAATQGAFNGAVESAQLATKAMTGGLDATALATGWMNVAEAMAKPAQVKVRANARRLTRRKG